MNKSINWFKLPLECRISKLKNNLFFSIGSNFNCKIISNNFNFLWGSHPLPILNKTSMPRLINSSQSRCLKAPNHLLPTPSHLNFLSPFIYPSSNLCHLGEVNVSSFPGGSVEKNPTVKQETWVQSLGWEDLLEKGKVTHSSILAWRIPWPIVKKRTIKGSLNSIVLRNLKKFHTLLHIIL